MVIGGDEPAVLRNEVNGYRIQGQIDRADALNTVTAWVFDFDVKEAGFEAVLAHSPSARLGVDANRLGPK